MSTKRLDLLLLLPPMPLVTYSFPFGLFLISKQVLKSGYSVKIIDAHYLKLGIPEILKNIQEENPRILGVFLSNASWESAGFIVQWLKQKRPDILIVGGGWEATVIPETVGKEFTGIDVIVQGPGEDCMVRLLSGESLSNIPNIHYRKEKKLYYTYREILPHHFSGFGFEILIEKGVLSEKYVLRQEGGFIRATYMASQGCDYGKCRFCGSLALHGRNVILYPWESVFNELEYLEKLKNIKFPDQKFVVAFYDDIFLRDITRMDEFLHEKVKRKCSFFWYGLARINDISEWPVKNYSRLHEGGCRRITIGIDAISDEMAILRGKTNRPHFIRRALDITEKLKKTGIQPTGFIVLGLPDEDPEERKRVLPQLLRTFLQNGMETVFVCQFVPVVGSYYWEKMKETGFLVERFRKWAPAVYCVKTGEDIKKILTMRFRGDEVFKQLNTR